MREYCFLFLFLLTGFCVSAQPQFEELIYDNHVYVDHIKSVQFYIEGFPLDDPIVNIDEQNRLTLLFDDLHNEVEDYFYTIIHCDMDWNPSRLNTMEYLDGFAEERIDNYEFSFKTLVPYVNYVLNFPNRDQAYTKTGNYLLVVYRRDRTNVPVITRRFVVYDTRLLMEARLSRPTKVSKQRTHQEIDFTVYRDPKFKIQNPMQSLRAAVLQNGRWDNAITGLKPIFMRGNEFVFDYQDKIVFPAGKEFRFIDIRSLRFRNFNIAEIIERPNGHDIFMKTDIERGIDAYLKINDANGKFTIENQDRGDAFLSADYADVIFSYQVNDPDFHKDIYLRGAFNDWQLSPEYRMDYNDRIAAYVLKVPLKQGYYNYEYVYIDPKAAAPNPDISVSEGHWHETENTYTILLYYRPFGGRYDQVIGYLKINSLGQ